MLLGFTINGTAEITGVWDVKITNIETKEISEGCDDGNPQFTNTTASFNAKLQKPGDKIVYVVTIQNLGTIDATLNGVVFMSDDENGSEAITYSTTNLATDLNAGGTTTVEITVKYDSKVEEVPSVKTKTLTGIIEYEQK